MPRDLQDGIHRGTGVLEIIFVRNWRGVIDLDALVSILESPNSRDLETNLNPETIA